MPCPIVPAPSTATSANRKVMAPPWTAAPRPGSGWHRAARRRRWPGAKSASPVAAGGWRPEGGGWLGVRQPAGVVGAVHVIELRCRAVDMQLENVRPVVMTREVVPELHLNPKPHISIRLKSPFPLPHP